MATLPRPQGCADAQLSALGDLLLCRHADAVSLWTLPREPGGVLTALWRLPIRCQTLTLARDVAYLTVDRRIEVRSLADGALLRSAETGLGGGGWQQQPAAGPAIRVAGDVLTIQRPDVAAVELAACTTGTVMVAAIAGSSKLGSTARAKPSAADAGDALALCTDGTAVRIDLAAGRVVGRHATELGPLHRGASAVWLDPAEGAYVGCHDGTLAALDWPELGPPRWSRNAGVGQIHAIEQRCDRVLVVGELGGATIWDARSGALQARLPSSAGTTARLASATSLWTVGDTVQRWRIPDQLRPTHMRLGIRDDGMTSVAISPDGVHIALSNSIGLLQVLGLHTGGAALTARLDGNLLKATSWSPDGRRLSAVGTLPQLHAFDGQAGFRPQPQRNVGARRRIADAAGDRRLALSYGGGIDWVDASGTIVQTITPNAAKTPFLDLAMSLDGRVGCAVDGVGGLWAIDADASAIQARQIGTLAGAEVCTRSVGGESVAAARPGEVLNLRLAARDADAPVALVAPILRTGGERIHDVAFSQDGRWLALAEISGTVRVLAWPSGREVALLRGHRQRVASIAFSPDDTVLVSASWDGSARLWSVDAFAADAHQLTADAVATWSEIDPASP